MKTIEDFMFCLFCAVAFFGILSLLSFIAKTILDNPRAHVITVIVLSVYLAGLATVYREESKKQAALKHDQTAQSFRQADAIFHSDQPTRIEIYGNIRYRETSENQGKQP